MYRVVKYIMQVPSGEQPGSARFRQTVACALFSRMVFIFSYWATLSEVS